jgi:hypothetical protein
MQPHVLVIPRLLQGLGRGKDREGGDGPLLVAVGGGGGGGGRGGRGRHGDRVGGTHRGISDNRTGEKRKLLSISTVLDCKVGMGEGRLQGKTHLILDDSKKAFRLVSNTTISVKDVLSVLLN